MFTNNNEKTAEELSAFLESYALVAALVASVMWNTFTHAANNSALVDAQVDGLGTAYLLCSAVSAYGFLLCSIIAPITSVMARSCESEECVRHWRRCARLEMRFSQVVFFASTLATYATVMLEAIVRTWALADYEDSDVALPAADVTTRRMVLIVVVLGALTIYSVAVVLSIAAKCVRSVRIFSADCTPIARLERASLATGPTPWFASPTSDDLRTLLDAYWDEFGSGPFGNPNPVHFRLFLGRTMHARGHGDVSHLAMRMADSLFEERIQQLLEASNVKVERDEQLVGLEQHE